MGEVIENLENRMICDSFLDCVMMHLIHRIFFLSIRNLLHHNEGEESYVGSQEISWATREDSETRAEISESRY